MRCFSRWALACGFCTLLIMLSGWTALGARSPQAAPPESAPLNSPETSEPATLTPADSPEPDTLISPSPASSSRLLGEPGASPSSTNPADEQALRDIMELRREQGGLFSGTLLEELGASGSEDEFLQALRTAASSHRQTPVPAQRATSTCEATYTRQIRHEQGIEDGDGELVQTLRLAGRQLDVRAADLEDAAQYEAADRLRKLARRLRRQARDLPSSPALHPLNQARR